MDSFTLDGSEAPKEDRSYDFGYVLNITTVSIIHGIHNMNMCSLQFTCIIYSCIYSTLGRNPIGKACIPTIHF